MSQMPSKINEILASLVGRSLCQEIVPYDGYVEVITLLTEKLDHRTFIKYEVTQDQEVARFEISHLFGNLDLERDLTTSDILDLLKENHGTFKRSSAYLGIHTIKYGDGKTCDSTFLESCLPFLLKWPSDEIAEMLYLVLTDIRNGFLFEPWPRAIYQFQPKE